MSLLLPLPPPDTSPSPERVPDATEVRGESVGFQISLIKGRWTIPSGFTLRHRVSPYDTGSKNRGTVFVIRKSSFFFSSGRDSLRRMCLDRRRSQVIFVHIKRELRFERWVYRRGKERLFVLRQKDRCCLHEETDGW